MANHVETDEPAIAFPWVQAATAIDVPGTSHVDNLQLIGMMSDAWRQYMNVGLGLDEREVYSPLGRPIVKAVTARFDREVVAGDELLCGVRATSRSTRSFTLEQVLWKERPSRPVASGTVVLVTIEPATGTAVEIPRHLWAAIESTEGRTISPIVSH